VYQDTVVRKCTKTWTIKMQHLKPKQT